MKKNPAIAFFSFSEKLRPVAIRTVFLLLMLLSAFDKKLQTQNAQRFFPAKDFIAIGSYYYPEQRPRKQRARDLKNMAGAGFEFKHFGEFARAFLEPEVGQFDFSWLDEAASLAHQNNIKVIMCTLTPTPPAWLAQKHPEILMVNADGRTSMEGIKQEPNIWKLKSFFLNSHTSRLS